MLARKGLLLENRLYPKGFVIGLLITLVIGLSAHAVIVHGFYIVTSYTCKLHDLGLPNYPHRTLKIQPHDLAGESFPLDTIQPWSAKELGGTPPTDFAEFSFEFAQNREALTLALTVDYLRQQYLAGAQRDSVNPLVAQLVTILESGELTPLEAAAITCLVEAEHSAKYTPGVPDLPGIRAQASSLPVKDYALAILSRVDRDCYHSSPTTFTPNWEHDRLLRCMIYKSHGARRTSDRPAPDTPE